MYYVSGLMQERRNSIVLAMYHVDQMSWLLKNSA